MPSDRFWVALSARPRMVWGCKAVEHTQPSSEERATCFKFGGVRNADMAPGNHADERISKLSRAWRGRTSGRAARIGIKRRLQFPGPQVRGREAIKLRMSPRGIPSCAPDRSKIVLSMVSVPSRSNTQAYSVSTHCFSPATCACSDSG